MSDGEAAFVWTSFTYLCITLLLFVPTGCMDKLINHENAINACEEELPRNQSCEITAKIKEDEIK